MACPAGKPTVSVAVGAELIRRDITKTTSVRTTPVEFHCTGRPPVTDKELKPTCSFNNTEYQCLAGEPPDQEPQGLPDTFQLRLAGNPDGRSQHVELTSGFAYSADFMPDAAITKAWIEVDGKRTDFNERRTEIRQNDGVEVTCPSELPTVTAGVSWEQRNPENGTLQTGTRQTKPVQVRCGGPKVDGKAQSCTAGKWNGTYTGSITPIYDLRLKNAVAGIKYTINGGEGNDTKIVVTDKNGKVLWSTKNGVHDGQPHELKDPADSVVDVKQGPLTATFRFDGVLLTNPNCTIGSIPTSP